MKRKRLTLAVALLAFLLVDRSIGDDNKKEKAEKEIDRIQKLLSDQVIHTGPLEKEMTLAKFLTTLEGLLPKGSKLSLRIDTEAFGKDLPKVTGTTIAGFPTDDRRSLGEVLRMAMDRRNNHVPFDYAIRDSRIVITRPQLAAYSATYSVRDVVEQVPEHLPRWKKLYGDLVEDIDPTDGMGLLVRLLANTGEMQPWETIQVRNGSRLVVLASFSRQLEIGSLLNALRRQAEVAVVMNARLYEMDRTLYTKHVAPHFARNKNTGKSPAIRKIDSALLKILIGQKLLLESEDQKLRRGQEANFLSQQSVFRFSASRVSGKEAGKKLGTALTGVSFHVRPLISADRRFLRLHITQRVVQIASIKTTVLDVSTGKDVEIEAPNRRKTSIQGTVTIPDGDAIVMPVDYRPASKDKVWLLVARPFIWIEEEVKELRRQKKELTPRSIWESEIPKEERPAPGAAVRFE